MNPTSSFYNGITPYEVRNIALAEMLLGHSSVISFPLSVAMAISNKCNYKCLKCRFHGPAAKNNLSTTYGTIKYEKFIDAINYSMSIILAGDGEPLINKDIEDIYIQLSKNKLTRKSLVTNGFLLEKCSDRFIKLLDIVSLSLDTVDEEKYAILSKTGRLQNVIRGISKIRFLNNKAYIKCGCVCASYNIDELEDIFQFCVTHGFKQLSIGPLNTHDKKLLPNVKKKQSFLNFIEKYKKYKSPLLVVRSNTNSFFQDEIDIDNTINDKNSLLDYFHKTEMENNAEQKPQNIQSNFEQFQIECTAHDNARPIGVTNWKEYYTLLCESLKKKSKILLPYCTTPWLFIVMGIDAGIITPCCVIANRLLGSNVQIQKNTFLAADADNFDHYYNSKYMVSLREALLGNGKIPEICKLCKSQQRYASLNFIFSLCDELRIPYGNLYADDLSVIQDNYALHISKNER